MRRRVHQRRTGARHGARDLGVGESSRLYRRLVYDDKIAQDVRASFAGEALGGTFEIVATAKPGVDPVPLPK